MFRLSVLTLFCASAIARVIPRTTSNDATVLILGGGVAGVIAARTLHQHGVHDFLIVEARGELGGRMMSHEFGVEGNRHVVEVGANWVQGTAAPGGGEPENPILTLAKKHKVKLQINDYSDIATYDDTGAVEFLDVFDKSVADYENLVVSAGSRVKRQLVDATSRTGYAINGAKPKTHHEQAAEYYQFDWEYAQTPEQTSWIASSWANNFTFDPESGGFGPENLLSVDQRGFKHLIQSEGDEFLQPKQVALNSTVASIAYSASGVEVTLTSGKVLKAEYALCTFSLGVLQHDDVVFNPKLPDWKTEAIQSMTMATYTKIFMQFPKKFWFEQEFGLYADKERGRYPVWQSLDAANFFPESGIFFATVTGDWSERIEALPDAQIKDEAMSVVRAMFPNTTVPEPLDFYFQRWHTDPLFRGSYSNWPASFFSEHHDNLRATVSHRLWFAGEATSQKWFGFLHGAYAEGVDTGTKLAKCVNGGGCVELTHVEDVKNANPYKI